MRVAPTLATAVLGVCIGSCATTATESTAEGVWRNVNGGGYYSFDPDGRVRFNDPEIDWIHTNVVVAEMRWQQRSQQEIVLVSKFPGAAEHADIMRIVGNRMRAQDGDFDLRRVSYPDGREVTD